VKPTVPEVLPLVRELYAQPGGGAGCCLHIVLDDGNVHDDNVGFCIERADEVGHERCLKLARTLLLMSRTQRLKLYRSARR
jgi:hypothetical protein